MGEQQNEADIANKHMQPIKHCIPSRFSTQKFIAMGRETTYDLCSIILRLQFMINGETAFH